jgi:hypothetical protein
MSNFLKIGRNGNFYLDGNLITTNDVSDINEYMMQLLGFYVTIEEGTTLEEIVHSVFGMKKFIAGYFSEEYEVLRAYASASKLDKRYKAIKLHKSFSVESDDFLSDEEFLYVLPEITFIEALDGEEGSNKLGELPVILDENIKLNHNDIELKLKSKFTLLDILACVFDEVSACISSGTIITVA